MNKFFSALLLFLAVTTQAQTTIQFINNDWAKARAEAKQKNKYLIVDAYTDWCGWCKVMDKETFPDKDVVAYVNANCVALKLEMEHNYGINVAMKYNIHAFPSFLVFAPDGKLVAKFFGYRKPVEFLEVLKKALDPQQSPPLAGISYTVDLAYPDFYKSSFGGKGKKEYPTEATVTTYLKAQKDLFSEVNYNVMVHFSNLLATEQIMQLLNNKAKYEQLFGKGDIDDVVSTTASLMVNAAIKYKSKEDLEQALGMIDKYQTNYKEESKESLRLNYFKGVNDWYQYAKVVDEHIAKSGADGNAVNEWAWTIYEKCGDLEVVKRAIEWMKPVIEKNAEYATTDTYAALLYKTKQFAEAKTYAVKAIELGKAAGQKTEETEALLKKIEAAQ